MTNNEIIGCLRTMLANFINQPPGPLSEEETGKYEQATEIVIDTIQLYGTTQEENV